jgi:PAS domain S-box-containing protein/putative nucleotidyltransferase with HDIG domain
MNTITLSHFLSYIADILLIIFVIGKNPGARTNHLCAFLIMTFSVWSLCYGLATMAHSGEEAMYFFNAGAVGWSIFPIAAVWFYLALTNKDRILRNRGAIIVSILIPAFFLYQQWTGNIINSAASTHWGWAAIWSHSIYSYSYLAYAILSISICAYSVIQYGREAQTPGQKKQARLLMVTGIVAVTLGLGTGVLYQLLGIRYIPQASDVLVMIWAIGIVYTISWYNLMSITPSTVANQILTIMNEAIMLLDTHGKIVYANRAATSLHESELKDVNFSSVVKDTVKATELLAETTSKGVGRQRELDYLSTTGHTIPMLVSASAVRESGDSIAGFVVSATDISERKRADEEVVLSHEMVRKTYHDAVDTIAKIMDMRDPYTGGHQLRVAGLAMAIAREMHLTDEQVDQLRMAATVHDIGKINIAADILNKPGALSKLEFEIIKCHSQGGYEIVRGLDLPCTIAEAILQHHERLDGSGYPRGLKKAEILIEAKILAVADVIEAMASHRPYRPSLGIERALEEVTVNRERLYDPAVVDSCLRLFKQNKFNLA